MLFYTSWSQICTKNLESWTWPVDSACFVYIPPFLSSCLSSIHALPIVMLFWKLFRGTKFFPSSVFPYRFFYLYGSLCFIPLTPNPIIFLAASCQLSLRGNVISLDPRNWNIIPILFLALHVPFFPSISRIFQLCFYLPVYLTMDPFISLEAIYGVGVMCIFVCQCVLSI